MISEFQGKFRFLSNFWPVQIAFEDLTYPSVEHAYVAAKTLDSAIRLQVSRIEAPGKVKRFGRTLAVRKDWDKIKLSVMHQLVKEKFEQPDLKDLLLATGQETLIEGNTWGDTFWGQCNGRGQNNLGKILMQVREDILIREQLKGHPNVKAIS